ncbi:MAG: hypothetical protein K2X77_23330 [Candidatus Obscuribacterales bacterium]|nr:hypothetical protein [Candidatus Obscuribacterales bacterium]
MVTTSFNRADAPTDVKGEGSKEQGVLAQALSGKAMIDEVQASTLGSFAQGGSESLQKGLDASAKDMNANLEKEGKLPERSSDLDNATSSDKNANIQAMMANEKASSDMGDMADVAMDNALQNVEKKEE